jgi:hypothetical protein
MCSRAACEWWTREHIVYWDPDVSDKSRRLIVERSDKLPVVFGWSRLAGDLLTLSWTQRPRGRFSLIVSTTPTLFPPICHLWGSLVQVKLWLETSFLTIWHRYLLTIEPPFSGSVRLAVEISRDKNALVMSFSFLSSCPELVYSYWQAVQVMQKFWRTIELQIYQQPCLLNLWTNSPICILETMTADWDEVLTPLSPIIGQVSQYWTTHISWGTWQIQKLLKQKL